VINLKIVE